MGSDPVPPPKVSTGWLERRSLVVGATLPIFLDYPFGQQRPNEPTQWATSDETIATIRSKESLHEIVGLRPGAVSVHGTKGAHECVETFHVVDPEIVESVGLYTDRVDAQAPSRFQLIVHAFYAHRCWDVVTTDSGVAWSSSDESVARVAPAGVVLGQGDGDARISIAFKGCSAHLDVHIEDGVLAYFSQQPVYFNNSFERVGVTTWISPSFDATVRNWRPRPGAVTLSVEPPGIVELLSSSRNPGEWTLRGLRAGTATITVRLGTLSAKRTIGIREPRNLRFGRIDVEGVHGSRPGLLFIGDEGAVSVGLEDDDGSIDGCEDIEWSSSAPEVLALIRSEEGSLMAKGLAEGNVTLRVDYKPLGVSQELALQVAERPHIEWF